MKICLTKGKTPKKIQRIYWIWQEQRRRCSNKTHPRWKTYGARGIRVEYSSKEFILWYLKNIPDSGKWHIGRKDHSKSYCFSNIEFQTPRDNAIEVQTRCNPAAKLNREQVSEIRGFLAENTWRGAKILMARTFGVDPATITYVHSGRTWL